MKPVLAVLARLFLVLLVYLFAIWVWPTPYYHLKTAPSSGVFDFRVNRITGEAQFLNSEGWRVAEPRFFADLPPIPQRFYAGWLIGLHR